MPFHRPQHTILASRLHEPRRFIQVVAGERWIRYVRDALIEPTLARDVLLPT